MHMDQMNNSRPFLLLKMNRKWTTVNDLNLQNTLLSPNHQKIHITPTTEDSPNSFLPTLLGT